MDKIKMSTKTGERKSKKENEDYLYCTVCRRNHNDGRNHIFSKGHKSKLDVIIGKFSKKIHSARCLLQKPNVIDGELEPGAMIWCYCCQDEIQKHVSDGFTTIEWGGLLEHMASHHKNSRHYCWENGIGKPHLQRFILFQAELDRFKSLVSDKIEVINDVRETRLKKVAKEIEEREDSQRLIVQESQTITAVSTASSSNHCNQKSSYTVSTSRGNVHTGATPPWLLGDDDDEEEEEKSDSSVVILKNPAGPSEDDFQHWREKHGKGKRNPKRIGADFHHNLKRMGLLEEDNDSWLPSFGRVWNSGPRSHSKMEFKKELPSSSNTSTMVTEIQPYVRKRLLKRTSSATESQN